MRFLVLLAFAAAAWPGLAQSKGESEGQRRLIKLNVAAIDAKGDPVTDLRATEVSLRERPAAPHRPLPFRGQQASRSRHRPRRVHSTVHTADHRHPAGPLE